MTRDLLRFRLLIGTDLPPYIYEGPRPIEDNLNRINTFILYFYLKTLAFPTPCCSSVVSTSRKYKADLTQLKEDLASMFKAKLGVDMSRSCLYQKPYPDDFDLVSYPIGWRVSDFIKFSGDDNRTT